MPRLMTYTVHRCVGTDRKLDVDRVAAVIADYEPDIVCLQELDVGRARTGHIDQAAAIAERLSMSAGATSMALTELQRWGVVKRVWRPGERKEFFEAETDFWRMISKVFDERERLIAESVRERLERAAQLLRDAAPGPLTQPSIDRVERLLSFVIVAQTALDGFIKSRRVDFSPFGNLVNFPLRALGRKKEG